MEGPIDMMGSIGIAGYIILALFLAIFAYWGYRLIKGEGKTTEALPIVPSSAKVITDKETEAKEVTLGTGEIKCLCFRRINGINVADFTTMPEPIGEMYQFDPSCPITGSGYIVKENEQGEIIDYDPREVKYVLGESPEYAWLAINGDTIIKNFWRIIIPWWKSTAVWFAAVMLAIVFITSLVVFD